MTDCNGEKMKDLKVAVVGLWYVGLPLALEFGKNVDTIGFDINQSRIDQLKESVDLTNEVEKKDFEHCEYLVFQMTSLIYDNPDLVSPHLNRR